MSEQITKMIKESSEEDLLQLFNITAKVLDSSEAKLYSSARSIIKQLKTEVEEEVANRKKPMENYTEDEVRNLITLMIKSYSTDGIKKAIMYSYDVKETQLTLPMVKESLDDFIPTLPELLKASKIKI